MLSFWGAGDSLFLFCNLGTGYKDVSVCTDLPNCKKKDFESIHYNVLTRQEASSSDHDIRSSEVLAQGHHVDMPVCLIQGRANESP